MTIRHYLNKYYEVYKETPTETVTYDARRYSQYVPGEYTLDAAIDHKRELEEDGETGLRIRVVTIFAEDIRIP